MVFWAILQMSVSQTEAKKTKKPKRKAGKNVLSFGDDGDEAEAAPVAKKAKYNTKLVSAGEEKPSSKGAELPKSMPIRKSAPKSPARSPLPEAEIKTTSKPSPKEKARSPPPRELSPESEKQQKLDRVNAQIAELKASMKRNTASDRVEPAKKKSLLESMVPTSTTRGRKRGAPSNASQEQATLSLLSKFKSKLEAAEPAASKAKSPTIEANGSGGGGTAGGDADNDEEEGACDLHFIVGCQSCKAWDKQEEQESDDDAGWMAHSLSFAKDRLGKDLEWKRKNEEELLVIDPREEAKRHKVEGRSKREWDDNKEKKKLKT